MTSDPRLLEAYDDYNKRFFGNSLPIIAVVWGRLPPERVAEFRYVAGYGHEGVIRLSPRMKFSDSVWHMSLLHEMVHVKLCDHPSHTEDGGEPHGPKFLEEIHRLVREGAYDPLF